MELAAGDDDASKRTGCRGIIQLSGPDACKLLQGLMTNDVAHLSAKAHDNSVSAAFLTAKGSYS